MSESSIDTDEQPALPPFWGQSVWWTRTGALLGFACFAIGTIMNILLSRAVGPCGLPSQLTNPTLAIEIAADKLAVAKIVGPCDALYCLGRNDQTIRIADQDVSGFICRAKQSAFRLEQFEDYVFICLYWLFFLYLAVVNWNFCFWQRCPVASQVAGKMAAITVVITASYGAIRDIQENEAILRALHALPQLIEPPMRDFAYAKWQSLFIAIAAASPIFILWMGRANPADARKSAFSYLLAWGTALLGLSSAFVGLAACSAGNDRQLEIASQQLGLMIAFAALTFATAQLWRGGTLAALDRLARLPILCHLTTLFSAEDEAMQNGDTDPNRIP